MLDHAGRRVDASTRPELSLGSYEFTAPESYANSAATCVRAAARRAAAHREHRYPSVLFLIDVSHQAVSSGFSDAVIQSVRQCISDMQYLKTRVGIAMCARPRPLVPAALPRGEECARLQLALAHPLSRRLDSRPQVRPPRLLLRRARGGAQVAGDEQL